MALVTEQQCKDYARIEHTAEDTVVAMIRTQQVALLERYLRRPLVGIAKVFYDQAVRTRPYGAVQTLLVPVTPMVITGADKPVVVDADGTTLSDADDFEVVDQWEGVIRARPGIAFSNGPYRITVKVGLDTVSTYAAEIEPVLNAALLDMFNDRWLNRNPRAASESSGGGISTTYTAEGIPTRVAATLEGLRMPVVGI